MYLVRPRSKEKSKKEAGDASGRVPDSAQFTTNTTRDNTNDIKVSMRSEDKNLYENDPVVNEHWRDGQRAAGPANNYESVSPNHQRHVGRIHDVPA